ncbi:MAG: hypothetical protein WKF37_15165 [Bryobacteraceae bacterium]
MGRLRSLLLFNLALATALAKFPATSPAAVENIRAADEFATQALQDPWDMNQRTDIGWYTQGTDQPPSNIGNQSFGNGIFSGTSLNNDPNFWLLDTGNPNAAPIGRNGDTFPIQSTKYKRLLLRMNLSQPAAGTPPNAQILWSNNTIYSGINQSGGILVYPGWWIYSIDLPALGVATGTPWANAVVDSLRVDPIQIPGVNISLDWARLVEDDPALQRTISWSGGGTVEIYLDNDANWANGNLGQISNNATGGTFTFYAGGLPFGTYKVAIRPAGSTATPSYSPGAYLVGDIPQVTFTSPAAIGSADDFATVNLNNPWDMDSLADVDFTLDVNGLTITNIMRKTMPEHHGSVRVLQGTSPALPAGQTVGDPRTTHSSGQNVARTSASIPRIVF